MYGYGQQKVEPENEGSKAPSASAYVSLVALGPIPARRYKMPGGKDLAEMREIENNSISGASDGEKRLSPKGISGAGKHAILLPPLEGAVPPASLYFKAAGESSGRAKWTRLRVGFNNSTGIKKVPSGVPIKLFQRDRDDSKSYVSYLDFQVMKPASQTLIFLMPGKNGKLPWARDPSVRMLSLTSKVMQDKNILLRNFSQQPVAFILDQEKPKVLTPGQRKSLKVPPSKGYHRVVAVIAGKNEIPLIDTSIRVPEKALTVIAFYDANPKTNAGKSVGVFRSTVSKLPLETLNQVNALAKP